MCSIVLFLSAVLCLFCAAPRRLFASIPDVHPLLSRLLSLFLFHALPPTYPDQRYGARKRPYMIHGPKSISLSIMRELGAFKDFEHAQAKTGAHSEPAGMGGAFRDALLRTSGHTFRGMNHGKQDGDDAYMTFLFSQ